MKLEKIGEVELEIKGTYRIFFFLNANFNQKYQQEHGSTDFKIIF